MEEEMKVGERRVLLGGALEISRVLEGVYSGHVSGGGSCTANTYDHVIASLIINFPESVREAVIGNKQPWVDEGQHCFSADEGLCLYCGKAVENVPDGKEKCPQRQPPT